ncbi:2-oxo acid dehydrogenase subunit E2 [Streptomyces chartreusis]|uniref:2-oxo acid dehydrogenase subunit E2 n=1 Tax=Streptomyces chartreusis TaxID=1969 RepID=UPI0033A4A3F4
MAEVRIPKLNNNDSTYVLLDWLAEDGARVTAGQPIATVETSKATQELEAPADGYLRPLLRPRSTCRPGDLVARIPASADAPSGAPITPDEDPADDPARPVLTDAARELAERHGLRAQDFAALGRRVVRSVDVQALLSGRTADGPPPGRHPLSQVQRAVARTVTASHRSVPVAFTVAKAYTDAALRRLGRPDQRGFAGLPELIVEAIGAVRGRFPLFFSSFTEPDTLTESPGAHVGVTVDVGKGLFVPTVRDADTKGTEEIATDLMRFRVQAMRASFREEDLTGSNIALSLNVDPGITLVRPLVLPGHVCAVSLSGPQHELDLDDTGAVVRRSYVHLGCAYDHRAVNGRDAARFLLAVAARLQDGPRTGEGGHAD